MKKLLLILLVLCAGAGSSFAQDVNKYLTDIKPLYDQNVPRAQWTLTMINSAGHIMFNGEPMDISSLQPKLQADMASKNPCYMVIIADVPTDHAAFQKVAKQYVAAANALHKKPLIYYGKYMPAPPPQPAPAMEVSDGNIIDLLDD